MKKKTKQSKILKWNFRNKNYYFYLKKWIIYFKTHTLKKHQKHYPQNIQNKKQTTKNKQ